MPKTYALVKDGRVLDVKEWPDRFDDHEDEIATETRKALIKGNEEEGIPPIDRGVHDTPSIHECFHPDLGEWIELSSNKKTHPMPGWTYEDEKFEAPPAVQSTPLVLPLSKRQILLWLLDQDKSDEDVLAALDKMRGKAKARAKIDWQNPDPGGFTKDNPIFARISEELSIDIDKMFSEAVTL